MQCVCAYLHSQELGQLEIKHGLMQLSETLSFVHRNAMLIHRGICPEVRETGGGVTRVSDWGGTENMHMGARVA